MNDIGLGAAKMWVAIAATLLIGILRQHLDLPQYAWGELRLALESALVGLIVWLTPNRRRREPRK